MRLVLKPLGIVFTLVLFVVLAGFAFKGCFMPAHAPVASVGSGSLSILADTAKRSWLFDQVTFFNIANRKSDNQQNITAAWKDMDTREAFQAILNGRQQPVVWVPSGSYWAAAMNGAWKRSHPSGGDLINTSDSSSYRVYLRTPLVFLTTTDKAAALRPLLNDPRKTSWAVFHDLCSGTKSVPWGRFHFAVADPLRSNSGFTMLALMLVDYAQRTGRIGTLDKVIRDPEFRTYIPEMKTGLVDLEAAKTGEGALSNDFADNPSHCDLILTYESSALKAVSRNPHLAVIYPNPTAYADEGAVVLNGPWVSVEQHTAARTFLDFLGQKDALKDGVQRKHFRPVQPTDEITLVPELSKYQSAGFQQVFNTTELPPYETVNEVAYLWHGGAPPTQGTP